MTNIKKYWQKYARLIYERCDCMYHCGFVSDGKFNKISGQYFVQRTPVYTSICSCVYDIYSKGRLYSQDPIWCRYSTWIDYIKTCPLKYFIENVPNNKLIGTYAYFSIGEFGVTLFLYITCTWGSEKMLYKIAYWCMIHNCLHFVPELLRNSASLHWNSI